jgi:hypothetical protein
MNRISMFLLASMLTASCKSAPRRERRPFVVDATHAFELAVTWASTLEAEPVDGRVVMATHLDLVMPWVGAEPTLVAREPRTSARLPTGVDPELFPLDRADVSMRAPESLVATVTRQLRNYVA